MIHQLILMMISLSLMMKVNEYLLIEYVDHVEFVLIMEMILLMMNVLNLLDHLVDEQQVEEMVLGDYY